MLRSFQPVSGLQLGISIDIVMKFNQAANIAPFLPQGQRSEQESRQKISSA
jgi:hypothetical protein